MGIHGPWVFCFVLFNLSSSFLPQVIVRLSALSSSSSSWTPFRKGRAVIRSRGDTSMDLVQPSWGDTVVGTNITKSPTRARTLYACPRSLHQLQKGASFWVVVLEHTCSFSQTTRSCPPQRVTHILKPR